MEKPVPTNPRKGHSYVAAIVLGVSDAAGKYYVPTLGAFLIYLVMVSLLLWRPLPIRRNGLPAIRGIWIRAFSNT